MPRWLKNITRESGRFALPRRQGRLPTCRLRAFEDADFERCSDIYRRNEPGRFPPGYFSYFQEWLRSRRDLILICEVDGEIRGLGGVSVDLRTRPCGAALNFGMVDPAHHRRGYGTVLLLARLAVLPRIRENWRGQITTTGGSESFYRRFGFIRYGRFTDDRGIGFDQYLVRLHRQDWQACQEALAAVSTVWDAVDTLIPPVSRFSVPVSES